VVLGKNHPILDFVMKCAKPSTHAFIHKNNKRMKAPRWD